jgi:hypothetical protein
MNIGEYCPEQYIILHERASAIQGADPGFQVRGRT